MNKPRFVLSRSRVLERYAFLKGLCPNISFSIKTNPEVGKILDKETDCFFSIHTPEGLGWVSDLKRVWYLAEGLEEVLFRRLLIYGIKNLVIDNEADLETLLKVLKEGRWKINLLLRMRFQETTVYKGRYFLFGLTPEEINSRIPGLKENPHILKLGVHFHRKSQNTGNWNLKYMLKEMLSEKTLEAIDLMNIGGGIPIDYKNTRASNLDYIVEQVKELREWLTEKGVEMIIEPGRPLAGPPVKLEAWITSISGRHITVNASVYNTSMDTIIIPHKLLVEGELDPEGQEGEGGSYIIKGCTPCSMDIFRYDVRLRNPRVGEKIVFLNAGAYNFTSNFCNLERPETVVME